MSELLLQLLVPRPLDAGDGEELLRMVERLVPAATPRRCGSEEPLRERFAWSELPRVWSEDGFLWKGRRGVGGNVMRTWRPEDRHSDVVIWGSLRRLGEEGPPRLLREAGGALGADYGALRLEKATPGIVIPAELEEGLPDVFWANVLGPPYVELFGPGAIESAPAEVVAEVVPGVFYVQLTQRLRDVAEDPERVRRRADAVKEHLGRDAFAGGEGTRRAPRLRADVAPEAGRPASAADVVSRLTDHAVEAIRDEGWVAPVAMALVDGAAPEVVGGEEGDPRRAEALIDEFLRHLATRAPVRAAVLLTNERDTLRFHVEVAGEEPFAVVRTVTRGGSDVTVGEPHPESAPPRGWTSAQGEGRPA